MSVASHPGDETLLRYAAGTLPAGPRVVVDAHLEGCPVCRARVRAFEAIGGRVLEETAPAALAPDALDRVLARLSGERPHLPFSGVAPSRRHAGEPSALHQAGEQPHPRSHAARPKAPARLPEGLVLPPGVALPRAVAARRIGALVPVAPGVRVGRVHVPEDPASNVLLVHIGAGRAIPRHTHVGSEYTQVICGAFGDPLGHYGPGDLVEADGEVDHSPLVDADAPCVCVAAFEGRVRFHGVLGLVMRPFI